MGAVVLRVIWSLVEDIRQNFGLRVVPRFERRLNGKNGGCYFAGKALMQRLETVDAIAVEMGFATFAELGGRDLDADASEPWFDCSGGLRTVRGLLEGDVVLGADVADDLREIAAALEQGLSQRLRFRFVVVAGTAMNGVLWEQLLEKGFY